MEKQSDYFSEASCDVLMGRKECGLRKCTSCVSFCIGIHRIHKGENLPLYDIK